MSDARHTPVLATESLAFLEPGPGKRIIDGTFGFGGHATAMLEAGAQVLGLDLSADAFTACGELAARYPRLGCARCSFDRMREAASDHGWDRVEGILLDLGVSSLQLDDPNLGFSYRRDGPLDLRFDQRSGKSAADLVNDLPEKELADLIWRFGEERASRRIARALVRARAEEPVTTTFASRAVIEKLVPPGKKTTPVLSRVFQALRIAVNHEMDALAAALEQIPSLLAPGGVMVVISYHSLEDRQVKRFIDRERRDCLCPPELPTCRCGHRRTLDPLTRKAVKAGPAEEAANPRSRSARLRAARRVQEVSSS